MRLIIVALLLISAHFSLIVFVPAQAGQAWLLWPFAVDTRPTLALIGSLPSQPGSVAVPILAGTAGLCFLLAALSLLGVAIPEEWWAGFVTVGAVASAALFIGYFGPLAIVPLVLDAVLLWGVFAQHWSAATLRGV